MQKYGHTLRICHTSWFSTATVVTRTRLIITFVSRLHCLSFCCLKELIIKCNNLNYIRNFEMVRRLAPRSLPARSFLIMLAMVLSEIHIILLFHNGLTLDPKIILEKRLKNLYVAMDCYGDLHSTFLMSVYLYRVIKNDCRGFNNLSYTIHLR